MMMSVDTRIGSLALAESVFIVSLVFCLFLYVCLSLPNKLYAWAQPYHARRIMWLACGVMALVLIILNGVVLGQNIEAVLACRGVDHCYDVCLPTTCKRLNLTRVRLFADMSRHTLDNNHAFAVILGGLLLLFSLALLPQTIYFNIWPETLLRAHKKVTSCWAKCVSLTFMQKGRYQLRV
jgi:hypothetical protein